MTIPEIKQFIANKVTALEGLKNTHYNNGDVANFELVDRELQETVASLEKMNTIN